MPYDPKRRDLGQVLIYFKFPVACAETEMVELEEDLLN